MSVVKLFRFSSKGYEYEHDEESEDITADSQGEVSQSENRIRSGFRTRSRYPRQSLDGNYSIYFSLFQVSLHGENRKGSLEAAVPQWSEGKKDRRRIKSFDKVWMVTTYFGLRGLT